MQSTYGRHRAIKWISGALFVLGALLVLLSTKDYTSLSPIAKLKAASSGFTVQDFAGTKEDGNYWPGLRVYSPWQSFSAKKPILIFIHGGGWVRGTIEDYDPLTRGLALLLKDFVVISVDYRLAPATKFPGALTDCIQAVRWVAERAAQIGGDVTRVAIAGDSAGGNLAIALAVLLQRELHPSATTAAVDKKPAAGAAAAAAAAEKGKRAKSGKSVLSLNTSDSPQYGDLQLCAQLFVYPVTDHTMSSRSYKQYGEGLGLTREKMEGFWRAYLQYPAVEGKMVLASPALAKKDDIKGMPPSAVYLAELDPLRDEGAAFAELLKESGVESTSRVYTGMQHGFLSHTAKQGVFSHAVWADMTAFLHQYCR